MKKISGKTKDEIGLFRTAISGGIAGVTLWTVIFPADVIKSRQQVFFSFKKVGLEKNLNFGINIFSGIWYFRTNVQSWVPNISQ